MGSRSTGPRRWSRPSWLLPRVAAPAAAAAAAAALLSGGGATAGAASEPTPGYAALAGTEPTGLPLVVQGSAPVAGPSWPANPPAVTAGGSWPATSSIRRLKVAVPGASAWIARSAAGGICALLYDGRTVEGVGSVGATCSTPAGFGAGASLEITEIPGQPGRVLEAGVEPDGVTAVSTTLADGSVVTTPVEGNVWARSSNEPSAPGSEPIATRGG